MVSRTRAARFVAMVVGLATATAFAACSSFDSQATDNGSDAGLDAAPDAPGEAAVSEGAADAAVGLDAHADAGAGAGCDPRGLFDPPLLVAGVNTMFGDYAAQMTPDELTVYFSSKRSPANGDELYVATRATRGVAFDTPLRMTALSTPSTDNYPAPSPDGLELFFARATSQFDMFVSRRATVDAGFDTATPLTALNSAFDDAEPYVAQNGDLYFHSGRRTATKNDIFRAPRLGDGGFGAPEAVEEVATATDDTSPVLSSDMLTLYFWSTRVDNGGTASGQIWVAYRASPSAKFDPPSRVVELTTAAGGDYPNWISPDNCRLYLTSLRSGVPQVYAAARKP